MGNRTAGDRVRATALARVTKELGRLDPWTFWTVPVGDDLVVAGSTGVFLVRVEEQEGTLEARGRRISIGAVRISLRGLRAAAKRLGSTLTGGSVFIEPEPVLCLTRATTGAPRTVAGVRLVHVDALAGDIARREKVLPPTRAQRAARLLGMTIAGDQTRHASIVRRSASG
jgi:hypothetical protein